MPPQPGDPDAIGQGYSLTIDVSVFQLAAPEVVPVVLVVGVVIAVDAPQLVGNGCQLFVQRPLRLQAPQQDDCGCVQLTGSSEDMPELTVLITAKQHDVG